MVNKFFMAKFKSLEEVEEYRNYIEARK